jgi:hypothetical protein
MPERKSHAQAIQKNRKPLTPAEKQKRKQRVLTQGIPSVTSSIADAVVIKNEDVCLLTQPDGNVPRGESHGFGLYYHDCRYLSSYRLELGHLKAEVVVSSAERGFMATFELTNPEIKLRKNSTSIRTTSESCGNVRSTVRIRVSTTSSP